MKRYQRVALPKKVDFQLRKLYSIQGANLQQRHNEYNLEKTHDYINYTHYHIITSIRFYFNLIIIYQHQSPLNNASIKIIIIRQGNKYNPFLIVIKSYTNYNLRYVNLQQSIVLVQDNFLTFFKYIIKKGSQHLYYYLQLTLTKPLVHQIY